MSHAAPDSSKRKITNTLQRWKGGLDAEELPLFKAFVEETLSRLRGPFLAHHLPKTVLAYLEEAFRFALRRPPGDFKVELVPRHDKGIAVFTCMGDQPFIVDTIRLFLRNHRANYWGGFNLVFTATRDEDGDLVAVGEDGGQPESLCMIEADAGDLLDDLVGATAQLRLNLDHARAMVRDFRPMTRSVERMVERCEVLGERRPELADAMRETAAFLQWLLRENFVFMGTDDGDQVLGIQTLTGSPYFSTADGDWAPPHEPGTVRVRKSHMESPVHRSGRIDEILVTLPEAMGERTLFIRGMFTYRAVTQPSRNVPILRRVLASILSESAAAPGSYRYKGFANVFDSLPTEFLFTATRQAIAEMVDLVFEAEQQQEVGVTLLMTGTDTAFCLVAMPKSQFGDELRRRLEHDIVTRLHASYCDHGIFVGRYDTVLLHYYLTGVQRPSDEAIVELTEHIRQLATPWLARVWAALAEEHGEADADRLSDTYGRAFPEAWARDTSAPRVVRDIEMLESLSAERSVAADLFYDEDDQPTLRLYQAEDLVLTDILPVLGNFGLVVHSSYATEVNSRGGALHMDTFRLDTTRGPDVNLLFERQDLLTDGITAVFAGHIPDDPLNGLVLRSGIDWKDVDLIRGYVRYARQLNVNIADAKVHGILLQHPITCRRLVELFHARFDPELKGSRARRIAQAERAVEDELRLILSHDAHLIVSALFNLISATVRTNFYRPDRRGYYVSFKLDCARVRGMGPGRPMWEIYVHNKDVEGVHLRFGKVARGGLRWSDRDDYRKEILGLATTQQVKNVVIVPTGAKGGFYLKNPMVDRGERRAQADELYKTFIRGLLDLTDNTVEGLVVPPPGVVRHDGDDPYLVVAADKGTAHLSDTANAISEEYGFWLGDAFASGGSHGYDHKGVGITARGAWKLVTRHFAERGVDPYSEPFTAIGIGDMSGDVFGNGMIETDRIRLVAAFNHLHIFIDPDPDPDVSYAERKRLFEARGGWDQYDRSKLSPGGAVYDRLQRSVPLTPEARALLGIEEEEPTPEAVIHRLLQLEVDLLWIGGIGTYVKASTETHGDAQDRANNAVRVDASQLRCKIIGEGGNLGLTQKARIEADLMGISLNTDAIDNSGGVDMSDHEVNLKILLARVVERGDLDQEGRNALLREMTEEVAALVIANNDAHGRQLSRDKLRSQHDIWQFARAIEFVEREFGRDRASLDLPDEEELARRAEAGLGLTRPELAVLSAWVKMYVFRELMAADPTALPGYADMLTRYFPQAIQERYPDDIAQHMLAREIAMTVATTRIVADAGAAFIPGVIETSGASVHEVAHAYLKAQFLARVHHVRGELEQLRTTVPLRSLYLAWVRIDAGARGVARYWLSTQGRIPTDEELAEMAGATTKVYELQTSEVAARNRELIAEMAAEGLTEQVAQRVLKAQYLSDALMIWSVSRGAEVDFAVMGIKHLAVARASRLQEILDDLHGRPASGRWDPIALRILYNRFHNLLRRTVVHAPVEEEWLESVDVCAPKLAEGPLAEMRATVDRILGPHDDDEHTAPSAATLLVLEERLQRLVSRF